MCVCVCVLTLQFLEQEGLAGAPLGVQTHADGRLHGGFAQDVGQSRAVQVVAQHVAVRLRGRQVTCGRAGHMRGQVTVRNGSHDRQGGGRRTSAEDLGENALLVAAVDVVRRLSGLVGPVQQAAIFGVAEQQLGEATAPAADGDVERSVSFLSKRTEAMRKSGYR